MTKVVLLDTGPLGMVTHPRNNPEIQAWLRNLLQTEFLVLVPEITDYELRRELLRAKKAESIQRLDSLKQALGYLPITTEVMLKAAELWAEARNRGQPTACKTALDADVILAAQAIAVTNQGNDVVIATSNVGHLERFVLAKSWEEINV